MEEEKFKQLYDKFLGPRKDETRQKTVVEAISSDLPGWKIAEESRKYSYYSGNELVIIKVESRTGGESKLADYRNGKVEIVQG